MRNVFEAIKALREIEDRYGVYLYAKAFSYGGARLMIRDVKTGEAYEVELLDQEMRIDELGPSAGVSVCVADPDVSAVPEAV